MSGPAARTVGLSKRYGRVTALDRLDLEVPVGQVLGLLCLPAPGRAPTTPIATSSCHRSRTSLTVVGVVRLPPTRHQRATPVARLTGPCLITTLATVAIRPSLGRRRSADVTPAVWAQGRLADGDGRVFDLDVNGQPIECVVPADDVEPEGATSFGLLADALSACTAMSVRSFLHRWELAGNTTVDVALDPGSPPVLHRQVGVSGPAFDVGLREQLAVVVDNTSVTLMLRDAIVVVTRLDLDHG